MRLFALSANKHGGAIADALVAFDGQRTRGGIKHTGDEGAVRVWMFWKATV